MKKIVAIITFAFVISIGASAASAQAPTRISFARGAHSKVVTGTLTGRRSSKTFVIRVRNGQTMTTENVGTKSITLEITGPPGSGYEQDMAADCHAFNTIEPTAAGDYRIRVTECTKSDAWKGTFRFKITVQ